MIATDIIAMPEAPDPKGRNQRGRFQSQPDSLERTTIGLRLPKSLYPRFIAEAKAQEKTTALLAREIIMDWMAAKEAETAETDAAGTSE